MKNYVKVMLGLPLSCASRNKHEIAAAYEAGYHVTVFCGEAGFPQESELFRYKIICRAPLQAEGSNRISHWCNLLKEWKKFYKELKAEKPNVISCHNVTNLLPVWCITRFMLPRPKLIYDCHEFFLYETYAKRSEREQKKARFQERFLMKRCAFSIMVNDSIADGVQKEHRLKTRPVVIRSTPPCWPLDEAILAEKRRELREKLHAPKDGFVMMYHGMINKLRGTLKIIDAMAQNEHLYAVFLGEGNTDELTAYARERGVEERMLVIPHYVPVETLWQYVGAADVGMMLLENASVSDLYSLPNKFFENIQSKTPILSADLPEMRRIIEHYGIGLICNAADPADVDRSLEKLRTDKEFYASCKRNLDTAKAELCWEKEKEVLFEAFKKYL